MSELDCATMMVKAKHIDRWQNRRGMISEFWQERFCKAGFRTLIDDTNSLNHAHHKFVIDVDNRDQLRQKLADCKIETKIHYERPLHELPVFSHCAGPDMLSISSSLARRVLSLPIYPELSDLEVEYISDQVLALA